MFRRIEPKVGDKDYLMKSHVKSLSSGGDEDKGF